MLFKAQSRTTSNPSSFANLYHIHQSLIRFSECKHHACSLGTLALFQSLGQAFLSMCALILAEDEAEDKGIYKIRERL